MGDIGDIWGINGGHFHSKVMSLHSVNEGHHTTEAVELADVMDLKVCALGSPNACLGFRGGVGNIPCPFSSFDFSSSNSQQAHASQTPSGMVRKLNPQNIIPLTIPVVITGIHIALSSVFV